MEIGQKVYWKIGNKKTDVVCIDVDGVPVAIKTQVELNLLEKQ
jgi:hypothetical protein